MLSAAALTVLAALAAGPYTITLEAPAGAVGFGHAIAAVGDVDGDGRGDLLVGMPRYSGTFEEEGWVGLYLGKSVGIEKTPAWTMTGGQAFAHFGHAVAGLGDVDGDGRSDFAVGAPGYSRGAEHEGIVYVWLGLPTETSIPWSREGVEVQARFGTSLTGVGDVDADGHADLLIGAPGLGEQGQVELYRGTPNGPDNFSDWHMEGAALGYGALGYRMAQAFDTQGDGFSDFLVHTDTSTLLFFGDESKSISRDPDAILGPGLGSLGDVDNSGQTALLPGLLPAGDVNGDGYADAIALDHVEGRVALLAGSPSGLLPTPIRVGDCDCAEGPRVVVAAGDLDGDGMSDIAIGAPDISRIEIWRGRFSGLASTPDLVMPGLQIVASAGDVNGDGHADLLAASVAAATEFPESGDRAVLFLGSEDGFVQSPQILFTGLRSVLDVSLDASLISPAGDVDNDGYSDVLIGQDTDGLGDELRKGWVSLMWGSPLGLLGPGSHRPPWTSVGAPDQRQGYWLAEAGDVNADGFADFLVGTRPSGLGRVDLYLGGALEPHRVWDSSMLPDMPRMSDAFVSGDLDGNGAWDFSIDDWTRGLPHAGTVLLGTPGASSPRQMDASVFAEDATIHVGVGDVNGDGYADILAGNRHFEELRGRADLYLGRNQVGLASRSWSAFGVTSPAPSRLGFTIAPAGDVDSDGYADFLLQAAGHSEELSNKGRVFLFCGGPKGPDDTPEWTHDGDSVGGSFGESMDVIGDVDGDGYSDLAIGMWRGWASRTPDPKVRIFFGNHGLGFRPTWRPNFHLRDLSTFVRIQPGNRGTSASGAYVVGSARSAFGPYRTALEVEVKPFDMLFDGRDTLLTDYQTTTHDARSVTFPISHLETDRAYHWRVRLRYDPSQNPPQVGSHWVMGGTPGQLSSVHFRTGKNNPPTVEDVVFSGLDAATGAARNAPGLLAYARDPDVRDTLTASKVDGPGSGTATVLADGTFFYKPDPGYSGRDSFRWRATDPAGASAIGTVTLQVEPGGACAGVSLTQCGRGRASAVLQTTAGPKGIRCRVIQTAEGRRLECDNDNGILTLTNMGPETCGGQP